ncbi:MAG: AAA family ATPase [bacterium]
MYLQKLEIQGFKSFANKSSLEFNRGVAAIVGPNGSGKSNVADAVRWVLGEQSMKILRSKKSEDVIFSGSDKKSRLGMAEVTLSINNEDRKMPIDYSEVTITRRIYRTGEGEYFLNKQAVRLQDIIMLLAQSNFGQKSYSVIGQGMVDSVLVATPQERKAFFDEAAGVRQYQIKREQATNKLKGTRENLRQAEMLMQEVEPRLRSLTRQVHRLERRQEVENDLRELQETYYSQIWAELSVKFDHDKKDHDELVKKQQTTSQELEKIQKELEAIEKEKTQDQAFRDLQRDYSALLDEKNALIKEQTVIRGRQDLAATQQGKLDIVWLKQRKDELSRSIAKLDGEMEEINNNLNRQKEKLGQRTVQQDKVLAEFNKLEQQLLKASASLDKTSTLDITKLREDLESTAQAHEALVEALEKASTLDEFQAIKTKAKSIGQQLSQCLEHLAEQSHTDNSKGVLKFQTQLTEFLKTKDSLVNEIHQLEKELNKQQEKLSSLQQYRERLIEEQKNITRELGRSEAKPEDNDKTQASYQSEDQELEGKVKEIDVKLRALADSIQQFNSQAQSKRDRLFALQKSFREAQHCLNIENNKLTAIQIELAKLETKKDDLKQEFKSELPEQVTERIEKTTQPKQGGEHKSAEYYQEEIRRLKHNLELIGGIDEGVTVEFESTNERYKFLRSQSDDLLSALDKLEKVIAELDQTIKNQFDASFEKINKQFQHYFRVLFQGGNAKLILKKEDVLAEVDDDEDEDSDENDNESTDDQPKKLKKTGEQIITGVDITATPPGKKLTHINMLSGGERALTSIALISAIISNNPSPFVFLDEVDAALDESNSQRFASIIEELNNKTQFVIITHNRATMEKANLLYGVTMSDDSVSKLISVKMEEAEEVIKRQGNR